MFPSNGYHRRERTTDQRARAGLRKFETHWVGTHVAAVVQDNKVAVVSSRVGGPPELVQCDRERPVPYLMPTVGQQYVSDAGAINREAHGFPPVLAFRYRGNARRRID